MKKLTVAVVLPCLNEEEQLWNTCKSLGFLQKGSQPTPDIFLFIIDNGSTDKTFKVARQIQRASRRGAVHIGQEQERGYVPPRHTGNLLAKGFFESNDLELSEVLILQADADTSYEDGYIEKMRSASQEIGANCLLEGLAEFSEDFRAHFPEYIRLCAETDARVFETLKPLEPSNLLCTDAVCGYRLSDYFYWGGHLREYRDEGDEIYAETTRLYMRALPRGVRKIYVYTALAHPSERKILKDPLAEISTAGFPREASWHTSWRKLFPNSLNLATFRRQPNHPAIQHALEIREQHLIALFGLLPLHLAQALGENSPQFKEATLGKLSALLPERSLETLLRSPGLFLADVLSIVDRHGLMLRDIM